MVFKNFPNFTVIGQNRIQKDYLEDSDIDYFQNLLASYSKYKPYSTLSLHMNFDIFAIPMNQPHIQIHYLSSSSNDPNAVGHWVTSYYDTVCIYIFDSMNNKILHCDLDRELKKLYPYYFQEGKHILFPEVQRQTNGKDCGIFAIAFGVSLLCNIKPNFVRYDINMMRPHTLKMLCNKFIEHFPGSFIPIPENLYPRKLYDKNIILNNCLNDMHIDYFHKMMEQCSAYKPCSTLYLQNTSKISQIAENSKHIQILFQRGSPIGHFICTYYDTETLYVYDSMNHKQLHSDFKTVLIKLHPYCFNGHKNIIFKTVQFQTNAIDCGVFSIAFAVTLLFGYHPHMMIYDTKLLRQHLLKMFEKRCIEHFPCLNNFSSNFVQFHLSNEIEHMTAIDNDTPENEKHLSIECTKTTTASNDYAREQNIKILRKKRNERYYQKNKEKRSQAIRENRNERKSNSLDMKTINNIDNNINNKNKLRKVDNLYINSSPTYKTFESTSKNIPENNDTINEKTVKIPEFKKYQSNKENIQNAKENCATNINNLGINMIKNNDTFLSKTILNNKDIIENHKSDDSILSDINNARQDLKIKYVNKKHYENNRQKILENKRKYYKLKKGALQRKDVKKRNRDYYIQNRDKILSMRRMCYTRNNKVIEKKKNRLASMIKKKYNTISLQQNTNRKLYQNKEKYVQKCMSSLNSFSVDGRLQAEKLVLSAFHVRDNYNNNAKKIFKNLQNKIEVSLTKLGNISIVNNSKCALTALCGLPVHTSSSEMYYLEAAYDFKSSLFDRNHKTMINEMGQSTNILPVIEKEGRKTKSKMWLCSSFCKTVDVDIIQALYELFTDILNTSFKTAYKFLLSIDCCSAESRDSSKLGHPNVCYAQPLLCNSKFLKLQILSCHYPHLRTIKRLIYELKRLLTFIIKIDNALDQADVETLKDISEQANKIGIEYQSNKKYDEICLNEIELKEKFHIAIKEYTKIVIDPPSVSCISCEKLFCSRDVEPFNHNNDNNVVLDLLEIECNLLEKIKSLQSFSSNKNFICKPCLVKLRKNVMPSNCILNKFQVKDVPEEIKDLNMFEKILIQRAKAFQTIKKMDTVMNKNLPHYVKIDKIVGRTFHLPLPLNETLKKICPDTDPLNINHELYILVRSHPSKSKIIWQDYVDIKKVWRALHWLKTNNFLYNKIELPEYPEHLLDQLKNELEYKVEFEKNVEDVQINDGKNILPQVKSQNRALLTQKFQTDSFYDHYTIYPLHNKKVNKSDTDLYQMLEVHASALDNRGKDLDLKCFPDLYPYGEGGQHDERNTKIRDFDFIKSRLASKHSQFRLNHQYIFYLLNDNNMRQINAGIFQMMNIVNPRYKYTVKDFLLMLNEGKLDANLDTIFSHLPGTEAYWKKVRNNLNCMVREYGPATFFITLSPGEWMWSELGDYIKKLNKLDDNHSISQLIALDPVSTARYFHNKFKAVLAYILSSDNPIGKVIHYYWVREYQGRGLPHYHCLFWIDHAPIYGINPSEEVKEFILQHITCHLPDKQISPEIYRRVQAYQQHKHNSYCMRKKKTKNGFSCACRFGFPRPISDKLILRDVSVAISNRNKLKNKCRFYDLPRTKDEQFNNDYIPALLLIWEGNNDAQYIGESSYLLTKYVCKYGTKGEKSNLDMSMIQSNKTLYSRLFSFAVRALKHRECGAIEAADTLLGHPLHATDPDTIVKWLNVGIIRGRKLKPYKDIKNLPEDSTDIFCESFVDCHYPNRPKELNNLCLYDFARWFEISKKKPIYKAEYYEMSNGLYCKKRKKPYLINHYQFNPDNQPESYYYALLLMFQPWRDLDELKGSEETYVDAFKKKESYLSEAMKYHDKCKTIKEAIENMNKLIQNELEQNKTDTLMDSTSIPDGCVPVEVENAMNDFKAVVEKNIINKEDLQNSISKFNSDQLRVFNKITGVLQCNDKILRMFVSGSGGTGKSFVIENLVCWNKLIRGKDTAVTAPTGIAAYNIQGLTIHRLLQLPVEHGGTAEYRELSGAALKQIRQSLKNVDLIIIDEISMVSNVTFMYIHLRLTEIFNTSDSDDGWFGKINVLVFGDLLQLPPVRENFVFVEMNKKQIDKYVKSMITFNLWELFDYDELIINMRQKNDKTYSEILSRIRLGFMTNSDIDTLQTRKLNLKDNCLENVQELCEHLQKLPTDTVCLLPTRKMCDVLNKAMILTIDAEEINLVADDSFRCAKNLQKKVLKALNDDEDNFCGIERIIIIKIGSKIMIRRNIDVSIGLVNGTICLVKSVSKDKSNNITSIRVIMQSGKEYDISRLEYKFIIMDNISIIRKQFPICSSYGITIHKSQGLSLNNAVVEAGNNVFSNGQTYVSFSRVTTLEGLHLINFDPSCCTADPLAILEYNRLRSKYRVDLNQFEIPPDRKKIKNLKVIDKQWAIEKNKSFESGESYLNYISDYTWNILGLENNDGVSCYANACVQSLFHSTTVRRILLQHTHKDIIKTVFEQYIKKTAVDIQSLRGFAGHMFNASKQQDAAEFLIHLINESLILQDIFRNDMREITRCPGCDERIQDDTVNYIVTIHLPESIRVFTLQDLIDFNIGNWQEIEGSCNSRCKLKRLRKVDIQIKNTILILQLMLFYNDGKSTKKNNDVKINGVPTAKISLNKKIYKVISGIFHQGDLHKGHYTNVLRENNNWITVNDSNVKTGKWPRSAKGVYIVFLEQI